MDIEIENKIKYILSQSPENIDINVVKEKLLLNDNDIINTISDLWNIEKKEEIKKEKTKIDELRIICNEMQIEIEKYKKENTNNN